jgi:hypothetical protein
MRSVDMGCYTGPVRNILVLVIVQHGHMKGGTVATGQTALVELRGNRTKR